MNPVLFSQNNLAFELPNNEYLFKDISLSVSKNQRIGLIGANGAGKSTLLHLVKSQAKNISIELVEQVKISKRHKTQSLYEYIQNKYENFWEIERFLTSEFGFNELDLNKKIENLSGGELLILDICIALLKMPDVLILDEPTNHLDLSKKEKLINILNLNTHFKALIAASHDINFLNQITNSTWELKNQRLRSFGGNYDFYKAQIENERNALERTHKSNLKALKKALQVKQKEDVTSAKKKAKLNSTIKSNDRSMDRFTRSGLKQKGQIMSDQNKTKNDALIKNALEKVESTKLRTSKKVHINLELPDKSNHKIIELVEAELFIEEKLLQNNLSLSLNFGDRLLVRGDNGSGKTTLLKALLTLFTASTFSTPLTLNATLKEVKYFNANTRIAYLSQKFEFIDRHKTVIENIRILNPSLPLEEVREILGSFLFYSEQEINKEAKFLSGGELMRLSFAMILCSKIDLLILDEPTNNIDIETKEVLVEAINDFSGTLIMVSHDQDFVQKIKISKEISLSDSKIS